MARSNNKKTAKKQKTTGRPVSVISPRESFSLTLNLAEGCMDELHTLFGTNKNATAVREAIHQFLGYEEIINETVDSNSSRQKLKEARKKIANS